MVKEISKYMLPLLLIFPIAQLTPATPPPEEVVQPQEVNSRITFTALLGKRSPRTSYL